MTWTYEPLDLEKRDEQSNALTWPQGDMNWTKIENYFNAMGEQLQSIINNNLPATGDIKLFGGNVVPDGWLKCDGSLLVAAAGYEDLYAVIGTAFGSGGVGTFKLPDLQGRVPIGAGFGAGLTPRTLGKIYGAETNGHSHTITVQSGGPIGINNVYNTASVELLYTPTGAVAIDPVTPTGAVSVDSTTIEADFSNIANHTDTIQDSGHLHTVTLTCVDAASGAEPGWASCNNGDPIDTSTTVVSIDLDLAHSGTQDLSHDHGATFTGNEIVINGGFTGEEVDLSHTHEWNLVITALQFAHTHTASETTATVPLIQPCTTVTYLIKT